MKRRKRQHRWEKPHTALSRHKRPRRKVKGYPLCGHKNGSSWCSTNAPCHAPHYYYHPYYPYYGWYGYPDHCWDYIEPCRPHHHGCGCARTRD